MEEEFFFLSSVCPTGIPRKKHTTQDHARAKEDEEEKKGDQLENAAQKKKDMQARTMFCYS